MSASPPFGPLVCSLFSDCDEIVTKKTRVTVDNASTLAYSHRDEQTHPAHNGQPGRSARLDNSTETQRLGAKIAHRGNGLQACRHEQARTRGHYRQHHRRAACGLGGNAMKCPNCGHEWKLPAQSAGGSKGGKASGAAKSRTSEQARAAVKARWEKARLNKANKQGETR